MPILDEKTKRAFTAPAGAVQFGTTGYTGADQKAASKQLLIAQFEKMLHENGYDKDLQRIAAIGKNAPTGSSIEKIATNVGNGLMKLSEDVFNTFQDQATKAATAGYGTYDALAIGKKAAEEQYKRERMFLFSQNPLEGFSDEKGIKLRGRK